jgi:ABC-type polar amino acid transport system ATPase subunit
LIEIRNLSLWYRKDHKVVDDVSALIPKGQTVVVCGPSGSGKSSLLRCINGLERFQQGEIIIDGKSLRARETNIHKLRAGIGMVFQHFELYPHMSVLDNITLAPRKVLKQSGKDAEIKAMQLLTRVGIPDKASRYPGELSGGQQQRFAIARSLAMEPKAMLFDEPTSALDPEMIKEVLEVMIDLAVSGMTMVVVTHEMGFAREVANEVVFMDHGRFVERKATKTFFECPENPRTREFMSHILT